MGPLPGLDLKGFSSRVEGCKVERQHEMNVWFIEEDTEAGTALETNPQSKNSFFSLDLLPAFVCFFLFSAVQL